VVPSAIEVGKLFEVVWVSLIAGVGVTALFSLVIYGSAHSVEARREGRADLAAVYGAIAALSLTAVAGGVVFAITVILNKS
jgi:hypothetical protein